LVFPIAGFLCTGPDILEATPECIFATIFCIRSCLQGKLICGRDKTRSAALTMSRQLTDACQNASGIFGSSQLDERSDGQLLEQFVLRRDERAFATLVQRYSRLVYGVCLRLLQNSHDADDAFQATFLVLAKKAPSLDRQGPLGNWLYTVAYRTATKARAAIAKRRFREMQALETPMAIPTRDGEWEELRPVLDEELNRLPEKYRVLLVLCYLEGKTHQEAARELGWPSGSLSRRMNRARELLRRRLTRRGITLSSVLLFALISRKAAAASVSPAVMATAAKAAVCFSAGQMGVHAWVSARVVALAEDVIAALAGWKLTVSGTVLLTACLLGISGLGAGIAARAGAMMIANWHADSCGTSPGASSIAPTVTQTLSLTAGARQLRSMALAPTGAWLAVAGRGGDERIHLWQLSKGERSATRRTEPYLLAAAGVQALAFSGSGALLASGDANGELAVWAVPGRVRLPQWLARNQHEPATAVAISVNGKMLASGGTSGMVRLWDVGTGKEIASWRGHAGSVRSIAFSPDETAIVTGWDDVIGVFDAKEGHLRARWESDTAGLNRATISSDGKCLLSTGSNNMIRLWDMATGEPHNFGATGRIALVGADFLWTSSLAVSLEEDGTMRFWSLSRLHEIETLRSDAAVSSVLSVASNRLLIATAGPDSTVRLWRIKGTIPLE
jgi:RNA polymerase sigma factor (sigma-70 family)